MRYSFDPDRACRLIETQWKQWILQNVPTCKFVLGISGGKDSTVVASLAARIFGKDNVYGVMMPNGGQNDLGDAKRVIDITGINRHFVNIKTSYDDLVCRMETSGSVPFKASDDTKINLAPRIRMAVLYALAQSVGGTVLNTDNLSEIVLGYYTIFGDGAGSYGPLRDLTAGEVVQIGDYLDLPSDLVHKSPGDGLQPDGDESRFGFTYDALDRFIRTGACLDNTREAIMSRYDKNLFKTEIVRIPHPSLGFENFVEKIHAWREKYNERRNHDKNEKEGETA